MFFAILVMLSWAVSPYLAQTNTKTVNISGSVHGGSGQHAIFVAIWDASGFLERPVHQIRIDAQSKATFRFEVPSGRWAISAFEDRNNNGQLDIGMFGPKEPNGFWHPFHGWRKPRFDDVAAWVDHDVTDADVELRK